MKRKLIIIITFIFLSVSTMAQVTVSGKVTNEKDGTPLPNVTVSVKGTTSGTTTDVQGAYEISVPNASSVLVFSSTGFASKEVTVGNQTTILDVVAASADGR